MGSQESNQGFFFPQSSSSFPLRNDIDDGLHGSLPWPNSNELNLCQGLPSMVISDKTQSTSQNLPFSNNFSVGQPLSQILPEVYNDTNHFSQGQILSQISSENLGSPNINPYIFYPQPTIANPTEEYFRLNNFPQENTTPQASFYENVGSPDINPKIFYPPKPSANPTEEFSLNNFLTQNTSTQDSFCGVDDYSLSFVLRSWMNSYSMANKNSGSAIINLMEENPNTRRLKGKCPVGLMTAVEIGGPSRKRAKQSKEELSLVPPSLRKMHEEGNFMDSLHGASRLSRSTPACSYDNLSTKMTTSGKRQYNPETSRNWKGFGELGRQTSCKESMNHGDPVGNSRAELHQLEHREKLPYTAEQSLTNVDLPNSVPNQNPFSCFPGRFKHPMYHGNSSFHHHGTKDLDLANQFPSQNFIPSFLEDCNNSSSFGSSSFNHDATNTNQDVREASNGAIPSNTNSPLYSVISIENETPKTTDVEEYQNKELDESKNSGQETETDHLPTFEDQQEEFDLESWAYGASPDGHKRSTP